jgi:formylglycine-generating enzyme required for sulfatase activity
MFLAFLSISCFDDPDDQDDSSDLMSGVEKSDVKDPHWTNAMGIEFMWIPPGVFTMGSPSSEAGRNNDEGYQHSVTISKGFWIGRFEIAQDEWQRIMGTDSLMLHQGGMDRESAGKPIEQVSWDECQTFINKLTLLSQDGKYSLPTEAQWEYACRAGTSTAYNFGNDITTDLANYQFNKNESTNIGSYPPNGWGLYDMHGNVNEWCSDIYEDGYRQFAEKDPSGPQHGSAQGKRVYRSGSWTCRDSACRSASRGSAASYLNFPGFGFRLVRTP